MADQADSPKSQNFKLEKLKHECEELKIKISQLEEENSHLHEQLETGGKRRGQIKKVLPPMLRYRLTMPAGRGNDGRLPGPDRGDQA